MNLNTILETLERFYPDATAGYLNVFTQARHNFFFPIGGDPVQAASKILAANTRGNLWFSPSLRREIPPGNKRGTLADLCYCPGVYVDIDIKHAQAHTDPHAVLPESWKEAMGLIEACPVHPSLIIDSGYGMQAWWLFADDKAIADAATAQRMANAHKAVNHWFFEIGQRLGYRLDKMVPLVGLARLPGTDNLKVKDDPREVKLVYQSDDRHAIQALVDDFMLEPPQPARAPQPTPRPDVADARPATAAPRVEAVEPGDKGERDRLREALHALPDELCDHYQTWINIGMALKGASESYYGLWKDFSERSPKFSAAACEKTWATLQPNGQISPGTIYHLADQHDAGWRTRLAPSRIFRPSEDLFDFPPDPWEKFMGIDGGFPLDVFPPAIRAMVEAVVETFHVPPIMAAMTAIGCASVALGKNYRLTIKEGHQQWGNLYIMLAVHPGVGKSPVLRPFQAPLVDKINFEMPGYEKALADYRSTLKGIKAQQAAIEEKIRQATKKAPDLVEELMCELLDLESSIPAEPHEPCFFLNDATSEAMARRMAANDGFIGVLSSEGRKVLEIARGKYTGTGSDVSLWLAGHGYDYFRQDRVNKSSFVIESPCVAALIMTQPDSVRDLGRNESLRESGFLARWLYVVPETEPQRYADEAIPYEVQHDYKALMDQILRPRQKMEYRFSPEAYNIWKDCHDTFKLRALDDTYKSNSFLASWMSKLPENIARLSMLLSVCWDPEEEIIMPRFAKHAAEMAEIFFRHTLQTNNIMCLDDGSNLAYMVWNWIDTNREKLRRMRMSDRLDCNLEVVKIQDLCVYRVAGLTKTEDSRNILEQLHERGYLRRAMIQCVEKRKVMEGYIVRPRHKLAQAAQEAA